MMAVSADRRWNEQFDRKCAERDELAAWLASLNHGPTSDLEATVLVRARLERVLDEIERLKATA